MLSTALLISCIGMTPRLQCTKPTRQEMMAKFLGPHSAGRWNFVCHLNGAVFFLGSWWSLIWTNSKIVTGSIRGPH